MTKIRQQYVDALKAGDVVRVELCFIGSDYRAEDGKIEHAFPYTDGTAYVVRFPEAGLIYGHIYVSEEFGDIVFNPSEVDSADEDLMTALQIHLSTLVDEAWEGALLRVCAINGKAA